MASLQKIALFLFFDAIENDLIMHLKAAALSGATSMLTLQERTKAKENLSKRALEHDLDDDVELLHGLDIGEKYNIVLRNRRDLPASTGDYILSKKKGFDACVSVRNSVMHGRPLTIDEYALGFALANDLLTSSAYWPNLRSVTKRYKDDPKALIEGSTKLLEQFDFPEVLNNLPSPDYEDTGFFPRPSIERELRKKILGRHPVITVLGDGGNGKTAVTLQTLYGLLAGGDHDFDAIIWVSAKSSRLTIGEIERIEGAITSSLDAFGAVTAFMQEDTASPIERVRSLLENNKVLLVIDNLETILDKTLRDFANDIPGESKLLLTSRVPLGSDLSVIVDTFTPHESVAFLRKIAAAYSIDRLKREAEDILKQYAEKLNHRPLLLKWFSLGILSGLEPSSILKNSEIALKFVLENVFDALSLPSRRLLRVLNSLPKPASIAILTHVSDESPENIEAALAELMRFTIVEQEATKGYELEYRVKPIAKSYLIRVLADKPKNIDEILSKYRGIESIYQTERAIGSLDRYNPRKYVVRSQSEALAVSKLRRVIQLALRSDFEGALEIVSELKKSHPDYFEVYRAEAFVSIKMGDLPRAQDAYQLALESDVKGKHPQLHHYYGGFLMRYFGDHSGASEQFIKALELDPDAMQPLIEAARAKMYDHEFDLAQDIISSALAKGATSLRSEIILFDIQLQNFGRRFEAYVSEGNGRECLKYLGDYAEFISRITESHLDETLTSHLRSFRRSLQRIRDSLGGANEIEFARLEGLFDALLILAAQGGTSSKQIDQRPVRILCQTPELESSSRRA